MPDKRLSALYSRVIASEYTVGVAIPDESETSIVKVFFPVLRSKPVSTPFETFSPLTLITAFSTLLFNIRPILATLFATVASYIVVSGENFWESVAPLIVISESLAACSVSGKPVCDVEFVGDVPESDVWLVNDVPICGVWIAAIPLCPAVEEML